MKKNLLSIGVFVALIALFAFAANDWRAPWAGKPAHGADWCDTHKVELSRCEKCNPKLARGGTLVTREREPKEGECPNTLVRVTLTPEVAKQIGIQFNPLKLQPVADTIHTNAETQYLPTKVARVAPRLAGVIREDVKAVLGDEVEADAVLALVDSSELAQAKSEYLQSKAVLDLRKQTFDQEEELLKQKITSGRERLAAKTAYEEAKLAVGRAAQRLSTIGIVPEQVKDPSSQLEVRAPFKGVVVEASAVKGESVTPDKPIFTVVDLDRLWLSIDVYEADLSKVEKGQRVTFTVEGLSGRKFGGKVVAIGAQVDDRTRTIRVFAEIKNIQRALRAKMFGKAEIAVRPPEAKLLVPRDAVQNDGDCTLVFVSPVEGVFQARKIQLGAIYEGGYEVIVGLAAGERVVTTGSFQLKTEVLRGQIGAG